MKVLVIGGGGREHALVWKLAQSPEVSALYASPGNPGMARHALCVSPPTPGPAGFLELARAHGIDLTVVGPEAPLVDGTADAFREEGLLIVGPARAAAQLEGSKIFTKRMLDRAGIPTARHIAIETREDGRSALEKFSFPLVLKADGLAAGKGVIIAQDKAEADAALDGLMSGALVGSAGSRLVIEEFLQGEEVSFIVLTDGKTVLPLQPTQDHKAVWDDDRGPNTGGMGAYCDSRILTDAETSQVLDTIIEPTVAEMRRSGAPYSGFLYAGLMMTADGPKVLEYNVRLGDPETQPLLHRLESDLVPVLEAAARGRLAEAGWSWKREPSVCVVLAAAGYPGKVRTGDTIVGIDEAESAGAVVFHAGTKAADGGIVTSGGRVLGVTARGATLPGAISSAYSAAGRISFDGMHFRRDIGRKGLRRW